MSSKIVPDSSMLKTKAIGNTCHVPAPGTHFVKALALDGLGLSFGFVNNILW
jgi:hypothetical protein